MYIQFTTTKHNIYLIIIKKTSFRADLHQSLHFFYIIYKHFKRYYGYLISLRVKNGPFEIFHVNIIN